MRSLQTLRVVAIRGHSFKQRGAEGDGHRRSRQIASKRRPAVRVKPDGACHGWPRALTQPRWLVNATSQPKKRAPYLSPRQDVATRGGGACLGGTSGAASSAGLGAVRAAHF